MFTPPPFKMPEPLRPLPKAYGKNWLTPEEVLAEIDAGKSAVDAFAKLDFGKCQFHDQVDTTGYKGPVIKMEGFGGVAKGRLALTPKTLEEYKAAKTPYISVLGDDHSPLLKDLVGRTPKMIFGNLTGDHAIFFNSPCHAAIGAATANLTWLVNPSIVAHYASPELPERSSISVNGITLYEGDVVTMDGRTGRLYPADLPIKSSPKINADIDIKAKETLPHFSILANVVDSTSTSAATFSTAEGIGLLRAENIVRSILVVLGNNFRDDDNQRHKEPLKIQGCNLSGVVYSQQQMHKMLGCLLGNEKKSEELKTAFIRNLGRDIRGVLSMPFNDTNEDRAVPHKTFSPTCRLVDLEAPQLEFVEKNLLSIENKKYFYALQAEALFRTTQDDGLREILTPIRILIPSVRSAEELTAIKEEVDKAAKKYGFIDEHGKRQFKFGAMMETKEAVQPEEAAKIAKLCDFVSFGTNDLTKELTGLVRDDLSADAKAAAKSWMEEKNYDALGDSPFDVLVPAVTLKMEAAVKAMRAANKDIEIGCCGRQVAANPQSIDAVMQMGLNNISVPPQDVAASRIMAAHFAAKKQLASPAARV
jgi:hypothetical protein